MTAPDRTLSDLRHAIARIERALARETDPQERANLKRERERIQREIKMRTGK